MITHEEFFISSTLPHDEIQTLYSYLIGCGECTRDKKKIKVFGYREPGKTIRVKESQSKPMSD